tara:strand:- start:7578 stop:7862 length:285 start_codon:yes stop_codon:yes gene_type:complete
MTSISLKDVVDDIIEGNGRSKEGGETITHIIEYHNIFDRSPTWKLCRDEKEYKHAMETGAFINPRLIWQREETSDEDDSSPTIPDDDVLEFHLR